eukprot:10380549-Lingulodinium_polyedra.AAC.1
MSSQFSDALLDIDEAVEVLETYDVKQVAQAQKDAIEEQTSRCEFKREFIVQRTKVRDLLAMAAAKAKNGGSKRKAKADEPPALPSTISQSTA